MSLHQYIGARYVPYFYQNSLDPTSTEWEPNVSYEPLTVVTLPNLHSYISKKYVPDTIGSPALNAEYWLDRGYDNAYIQALQDQIDDMNDGTVPGSLQNQIDSNSDDISILNGITLPGYSRTLTANEILIVTDSFGANPLGNVLTGFNKCLSGVNTLYQSGANFGGFASLLTGYTGDKTAIKSIIMIGGTNQHSTASIASDFNLIDTALEDYPNATVFVAFIKSSFTSASERALVTPLIEEIRKQCINNRHYVFLGNFNHCFYPTFANIGTDGIHPTPSGGERIGTCIFNKYVNDDNNCLSDSTATASSNGITFTLQCDINGEISVRVIGTTTSAIAAGSYIDLDFDSYYDSDSLPAAISSTPIPLSNGGILYLGLNAGRIKYYYSPEGSGQATLPSGTYIASYTKLLLLGEKKYKVTN